MTMTIDKAIECNTEFLEPLEHTKDTDTYKALAMANEALKTIKEMRHYPFPDGVVQLPGETKE